MAPFRTLKVWQHAQRLAIECARAAKGSREFRRFLDVARGSLAEVESALDLAKELEYIDAADYARLDGIATQTAKTLWGLLRKVGDRAMPHPTP